MSANILSLVLALGQVVPLVKNLLDKNNHHTVIEKVAELAKNITNTQKSAEVIKTLEQDLELRLRFEQSLLQLEGELEKSGTLDRQSARKRDIEFLRLGKSNIRADIMVVAAALGLICCLSSLVFFQRSMPGEAVGIISTIAGIFGACLKDAYAFEFGSSRGSKEKDDHMTTLIQLFDGKPKSPHS